MKCPFCKDKDKETSVLDSRPTEEGSVIRRRRVCGSCKERFTTFERIQYREFLVVKKNGDKSVFDGIKLPNLLISLLEKDLLILKQKKNLFLKLSES